MCYKLDEFQPDRGIYQEAGTSHCYQKLVFTNKDGSKVIIRIEANFVTELIEASTYVLSRLL